MSGITVNGFERERLADIKTEMEQELITTFGTNTNVGAESIFGQMVGLVADRLDKIWSAMEDGYNSQYPDTAFGASLDNVGAISGIPRKGALASKALSVRLFGTAGTLIPGISTQVSVSGSPTSIFQTDNDVTLAAGQDCMQTLTFTAVPTGGQWKISWHGAETSTLAFNANAAAVQAALVLLPFAAGITVTGNYSIGFTVSFLGVSGKQDQPAMIISVNTLVNGMTPINVSDTITQPGINQAVVNCTAIVEGPVIANARSLTVIVTPVTGLSSVLNVTDAIVGRIVEEDNPYRARRQTTLQIAGAGTVEAIRSRLLQLTGVTACIVFENDTEIDDPDGRPPKSFEAVVQGADDQDILDLIWMVKPAGIRPFGTTMGQITDSQGQVHDISFSRPTNLDIYVKLTLTINADFPANGAASARQLLVDRGNLFGIGKEVIVSPILIASIVSIPGIEDVEILIGTAPSPTLPDNIPVAANEVPVFDTSRVTVITI